MKPISQVWYRVLHFYELNRVLDDHKLDSMTYLFKAELDIMEKWHGN